MTCCYRPAFGREMSRDNDAAILVWFCHGRRISRTAPGRPARASSPNTVAAACAGHAATHMVAVGIVRKPWPIVAACPSHVPPLDGSLQVAGVPGRGDPRVPAGRPQAAPATINRFVV
jgi:hypothetical protein